MRTLLLLIKKFRTLLLFIGLEIIAFMLIANSRSIQGADILSSSNALAAYGYEKKHNITAYFQLKNINKDLVAENAALRNQLAQLTGVDTYQNALVSIPITRVDSIKVKDTLASADSAGGLKYKMIGQRTIVRYAQYEFMPARVINNSISNDNINYITINRGEKDGVKKGMAVVSTNGVVGRVANTSAHYATIVSILSTLGDRKISAQLPTGTTGFAFWKPGDPEHMELEPLPLTTPMKVGDAIYTTGYSYFPENVSIGHINRIDTITSTNKKAAHVRLTTNFRNLHTVYVVTNELDEERKTLEANTKQNDQK